MNYNQNHQAILGLLLALLMFGVALELRTIAFKAVIRKPIPVLAGLLGQFILLPWLTFLATLVLDIHPGIKMGMLLVAACPGGNLSNVVTHLAHGNTALSVSMTAVSSVLAIVLLPLNFGLTASLNPATADFMRTGMNNLHMDGFSILKSLIVLLLIPMALGMVLGNLRPKLTSKITPWFKRFSMLAFSIFLLIAISANWAMFRDNLGFIFLVVVLHNGGGLLIGAFMGVLFRQPPENRRAITIEVGMQNSGLALGLILSQFGGEPNMALIAAFWGTWHIVSGLLLVLVWRRFPIQHAEASV